MKTILIILLCSFAAQAQNAKIYFIRKQEYKGGLQSFTAFSNSYIYIDSKRNCGHKNNYCYAVFEITPGEHTFSVARKSDDLFRLNIEPGKDYYMAWFPNEIWQLTEDTGKRLVDSLVREVDCSAALND